MSTFRKFDGASVLVNSYDVKMSYFGDDSFYVTDETLNVIILYNANGTFVKKLAFTQPFFISPAPNGYIYISARYVGNKMYRCDTNLNTIQTFTFNAQLYSHSSHVRYSNHTGRVYECDETTGFVNVFDLDLHRLPTESINFKNVYGQIPFSITTYQSDIYGTLLYVVSNNLYVIITSNKSLLSSVNNICPSNIPLEILVEPTGEMLFGCHWENIVRLWYTNGTNHYYTGKFLTTPDANAGMAIDSYGRLLVASRSVITVYTPPDIPYVINN